jgi:hypothetical protein
MRCEALTGKGRPDDFGIKDEKIRKSILAIASKTKRGEIPTPFLTLSPSLDQMLEETQGLSW